MSKDVLGRSGAQKGFTLIEMSIVLVIIGLIIGGILKGQEIIDASRQKNLITQIDSYRAAMNTFADKYNGLAGDFARASTVISAQALNGDGNGIVNASTTNIANIVAQAGNGSAETATTGENMNFFCQLSQANLSGGSATICNTAATFFGGGSPLPATAYSNVGITVATGLFDAANPRTALWARVHRTPATAANGGLTARVLSQIDSKYDDSLPIGGLIRSGNVGTGCPAAAATSVYVPTQEAPDCLALFELSRN